MEASSSVVIHHPNREKAGAKATKAGVILLLLVSAALIAIVLLGGWKSLAGAEIVPIAYVIIYCVMAYFVARWSRGVLAVAAGLALIFAIMAGGAGPAWFERDKAGFDNPGLPPGILGLLTLVIVAGSFLRIVVAMRGFNQAWNVEIEVSRAEAERGIDPDAFDEKGRRLDDEEGHAEDVESEPALGQGERGAPGEQDAPHYRENA